jgi:hypothetical protein
MQNHEENLASRVNGSLQPLLGVMVSVKTLTGLLATIYGDDGVTVQPNPMFTNANGLYGFRAANGPYKLTFSGPQIESYERDIDLYDPDDEPPLTQAQAALPSAASRVGFQADGVGAQGRTIENKLRETVSVKDFGAVGDGVADDTAAIQAALDSGAAHIAFPPGAYALSDAIEPYSGQVLEGSGWPVLIALAGSTASPLLMNVNTKNDVRVTGFIVDGNTAGITGFSNVLQTFNSNRVEISGNRFRNCRGIAVLISGGTYIEALRNEFDSCGIYHLISAQTGDRKQAIAFSNASFVTADDNDFRNIGLDCISFTGGTDARATRNRIAINYAGTIYLSNMTRAVIEGNQISNGAGGGNGIDIINSKDITIGGNVCRGCGAAGMMIAGNSSNIAINSNICSNNWKSGTSLHRGGITLAADTGQAMNGVTLAANICYDDQGPGAVTQRYAIGVYANGGTFSRVMVDQSNSLTGYNSGGNVDNTNVFQSTAIGIVGFSYTFNLADQAEVTLYTALGLQGEFAIYQGNNGYYGRFLARVNNGALELQDVSTQFETTDTGTTQAVYRDVATNTVRLKNRTGGSKTYTITPLTWGYS